MSRISKLRDGFARRFGMGAIGIATKMAATYTEFDFASFLRGDDRRARHHSGQVVDQKTVTAWNAASACQRILYNTIAMLPWNVRRLVDDRGTSEVSRGPVQELLTVRPNSYQTPFEFKAEIAGELVSDGNFYVEKVRGRRVVGELWPIPHQHIYPDWFNRKTGREKVYDISSGFDGRARTLTGDDIAHGMLRSVDYGLTGESPVILGALGLSVPMAVQQMVSNFFTQGARPSGILTGDKPIDAKRRQELDEEWRNSHGGLGNMQKTAVLGSGLTYQAIAASMTDAQAIQLLEWGVSDTARVYGIPLWMLQSAKGQNVYGTGVEQVSLGFVRYTLNPYNTLIEQAITRSLVFDSSEFVRFNVDEILRGDVRARFAAYQLAVNANNPWLMRNEIRSMENLPPDDTSGDGDRFLLPENNMGAGAAQGGDNNGGGNQQLSEEEMLAELVRNVVASEEFARAVIDVQAADGGA